MSAGRGLTAAELFAQAAAGGVGGSAPGEPWSAGLRARLLSPSDLADLDAPTPLVQGLIYRGTLAQLVGVPGSYKSFVAISIAASVATGRPFAGHRVPHQAPVIYVAAEGASGFRTRIAAWCEVNGVDPADLDGRLYILPEAVQLGDAAAVAELSSVLADLQPGLVVIDTRARCTSGSDENAAGEQGRLIDAADRLVRASGAAVLILHHAGRAGEHGRGSSAWDGACWSLLSVAGSDLRAKVRCAKHKDVRDGCEHHLQLAVHRVAPELLPQRPGESLEDWEARRTTLAVCPEARLDILETERRSVRLVLDKIRTLAGTEGLTRPQVVAFAEDAGVSRSAAYEAVATLIRGGFLRNVGSRNRPRYVAAGSDVVLVES